MIRTNTRVWFVCLLLASLPLGCAYAPPDMIARTQGTVSRPPSPFSQAAAVVAPVTGVHTSFWQMVNGDVMVQMSTFREALIQSLRHSDLFGSVSGEGAGRYVLRAEIMKQDKFANGATLSVRYVLADTSVGQVLFTAEVETSSTLTEDSAPGASLLNLKTSISRAAFRAAGKNIEAMLGKLRTIEAPAGRE